MFQKSLIESAWMAVDIQTIRLASVVSCGTIYGCSEFFFFKGMLGVVRLAELRSSNGSAVHYLCTESATTVKIQDTKKILKSLL